MTAAGHRRNNRCRRAALRHVAGFGASFRAGQDTATLPSEPEPTTLLRQGSTRALPDYPMLRPIRMLLPDGSVSANSRIPQG